MSHKYIDTILQIHGGKMSKVGLIVFDVQQAFTEIEPLTQFLSSHSEAHVQVAFETHPVISVDSLKYFLAQ